MKKNKSDLAHAYLQLLDAIQPATEKACAARRSLVTASEESPLTVTAELGLLREWYQGSKHLIGSD
jgi:hypothetical protein